MFSLLVGESFCSDVSSLWKLCNVKTTPMNCLLGEPCYIKCPILLMISCGAFRVSLYKMIGLYMTRRLPRHEAQLLHGAWGAAGFDGRAPTPWDDMLKYGRLTWSGEPCKRKFKAASIRWNVRASGHKDGCSSQDLLISLSLSKHTYFCLSASSNSSVSFQNFLSRFLICCRSNPAAVSSLIRVRLSPLHTLILSL